MFTSVDKALVAAIMGLAYIASQFGIVVPAWFTEPWVTTVLGIITPFLVYFVPNKK